MPPPANDEWAEPEWRREYNKHHPVPSVAWDDVVRSTGENKGKQQGKPTARYGPHPRITAALVERIEMEAVRREAQELPRHKPHVRAFWAEFGEVIGASNGQETTYIYVEWHRNGAVHGRPMTWLELIRKGMPA